MTVTQLSYGQIYLVQATSRFDGEREEAAIARQGQRRPRRLDGALQVNVGAAEDHTRAEAGRRRMAIRAAEQELVREGAGLTSELQQGEKGASTAAGREAAAASASREWVL